MFAITMTAIAGIMLIGIGFILLAWRKDKEYMECANDATRNLDKLEHDRINDENLILKDKLAYREKEISRLGIRLTDVNGKLAKALTDQVNLQAAYDSLRRESEKSVERHQASLDAEAERRYRVLRAADKRLDVIEYYVRYSNLRCSKCGRMIKRGIRPLITMASDGKIVSIKSLCPRCYPNKGDGCTA